MRRTLPQLALACGVFALAGCSCDDPRDVDGGLADGEIPITDGAVRPDGRIPPGVDAGPGDGVPREGPVCTPRGWCWETPLPAGGSVSGLWSPSPGQVIGGSGSYMFHVDGDTIRSAPPPTLTPYLNAIPVWGSAPDDVWANAFGSLIHYDGNRWSQAGGGVVAFSSAISGVDSRDVWSVGFSSIHHYDGTWSAVELGTFSDVSFTDVWAIGPNEAIVVGVRAAAGVAEGVVLHVDGDAITDLGSGAALSGARSVYASGPGDVWVAVGTGMRRLQAGTWSPVDVGTFGVLSMWGSGPDDVWMTGRTSNVLHWNGASVETHPIEGARQLLAIAGTSSADVWASDADGQLHHWDGASWTRPFKAALAPTSLSAAAVGDDGQGWAVGTQHVLRRATDGSWSLASNPTTSPLVGVSLAGGETFLFATGGSYRWDGSDWRLVLGGAGLRDACATGDGVIRAVGDRLATYVGGEWVTDDSIVFEGTLAQVRCLGDEAWAHSAAPVSSRDPAGPSLHFDGSAWRRLGLTSLEGLTVRAARATAVDDAWIVVEASGASIVMRWDGAEWAQVDAPSTVLGVGGDDPGDVWLVGEAGLARRWDGATWTVADLPSGDDLRWVDSLGPGTARAVTVAGDVWDYGPAGAPTWTRAGVSLGDTGGLSSRTLHDVAFANGEVFGAGESYEALRFASGVWTRIEGFSATDVEANDEAGAWFTDIGRAIGRFDGVSSIVEPDPSFSGGREAFLVPARGDAVYTFGSHLGYRLNGSTWTEDVDPDGECCTVVFGSSPDDVWMINWRDIIDPTLVRRRDASGWSAFTELVGVIGISEGPDGRLLALDRDLAMWRREDGRFRRISEPREGFEGRGVAAHVYDIDDAWVLALGGLLRWDGAGWSQLADPVGLRFQALEATPDGTLYAVGDGASVARRAP